MKIEPPPKRKLCPNEQRVYDHIKSGWTYAQIAHEMRIPVKSSPHYYYSSVEDYVQEIRRAGYDI